MGKMSKDELRQIKELSNNSVSITGNSEQKESNDNLAGHIEIDLKEESNPINRTIKKRLIVFGAVIISLVVAFSMANSVSKSQQKHLENTITAGASSELLEIAGSQSATATPHNNLGISLKEYNEIEPGMTYAQVCNIIGSEGDEETTTHNSKVCTWNSESTTGYAVLFFMNGQLSEKHKVSLTE